MSSPINYTANNHAVMLNTDFTLSDRTRLYTQFSLNESGSALSDLDLVASAAALNLPATYLAVYNPGNVSDYGTFSNLRVRRFLQVVGFEHRLSQRFITRQEFWWHDYKDGEPYLFDTNGRNLGLRIAFNYVF